MAILSGYITQLLDNPIGASSASNVPAGGYLPTRTQVCSGQEKWMEVKEG